MGKILFAERDGVQVLKFVGDVRVTLGPTISTFLSKLGQCKTFKSVIIDLTETEGIDSTSLGLLAKISLTTQEAFNTIPTIVSPNEDISRILESMGFGKVFVILEELITECGQLGELPTEIVSESNLRKQVLEAHKVLMSLNERNQGEFRELVHALQHESLDAVPVPRNRVA
ncbi:MAG: STAS domain-containing protein [Gammaproteobacteria bacterium]|nr:STAS domain-containing protein [Gammaproteobacteria bacterium]